MEFGKQTATILHDEHMRVQATLDRFSTFLGAWGKADNPAESGNSDLSRVAQELRGVIQDELPPHFAFEEEELFPRLSEAGEGTLGELLSEEHETVWPVANRLAALSDAAIDGSLDQAGWEEFRRIGADFIETMTAHIQKEEVGLLSSIEAMLDEDDDRELAMAYLAAR